MASLIASRSFSSSKGFSMKSTAPPFIARTAVSMSPFSVITMIGSLKPINLSCFCSSRPPISDVRPTCKMPRRRQRYRQTVAVQIRMSSLHPLTVIRTIREPYRCVPRVENSIPSSDIATRWRDLLPPGLQSGAFRRLQCSVNAIKEFVVGKRFGEVAYGPRFQRLDARPIIGKSRDEDDRDRMVGRDQMLLQLEPVHTRHMHVQDQAGRLLQPLGAEKLLGRCKGFDGDAK